MADVPALARGLLSFGVRPPLALSNDPAETGVVKDATGHEVFTVDTNGDRWRDRDANAIARLIAGAVNAAAGGGDA